MVSQHLHQTLQAGLTVISRGLLWQKYAGGGPKIMLPFEQFVQKKGCFFPLFHLIAGFLTLPASIHYSLLPRCLRIWGDVGLQKGKFLLINVFLLAASPQFYQLWMVQDVCQLHIAVVFPLKLLISSCKLYTVLEWPIWQQAGVGGISDGFPPGCHLELGYH